MKLTEIRPEVYELAERARQKLEARFREIDRTAEENTRKVMQAFQNARVSDACFAGTTGYGYDDLGRETLDKIYAEIFHTEAALVRVQFVNGTHALTAAMFALAAPGQKILAVTGMPYDTLRTAIGISGNAFGSLKFYGIEYGQVDLTPEGDADLAAIAEAVKDETVAAVMIQRSRGYEDRKALSVAEIGKIVETVKERRPDVAIMVDNCYGEFTDVIEPTDVGADLIAGSLIKNPGGGIAPTGGYLAGVCRAGGHATDHAGHRRRVRVHAREQPAAVPGPLHGAACRGAGTEDGLLLCGHDGGDRHREFTIGAGGALGHHPDGQARLAREDEAFLPRHPGWCPGGLLRDPGTLAHARL